MDSMVNRYTSDRRVRSDDAYTPGGAGGKRPDRCVIVYSQRMREAYKGVPIVIGGIEASLRRIAHFDYWSEQVRRSVLVDAKADLWSTATRSGRWRDRAAARLRASRIGEHHGFARHRVSAPRRPGGLGRDRFQRTRYAGAACAAGSILTPSEEERREGRRARRSRSAGAGRRSPGGEILPQGAERPARAQRHPAALVRAGGADAVLYAHASRILHLESNPGNARALVQRHGIRSCGSIRRRCRLSTADMDAIYELPYARRPHPTYGNARDSGLSHDPILGGDSARLLRRLHFLLDHRTRGTHHPEPLRGFGDPRDRDHPRHRARDSPAWCRISAARRRTCTACTARAPPSNRPAGAPRACTRACART